MYNQVYHLDFYRNNIKLNLEKKRKEQDMIII